MNQKTQYGISMGFGVFLIILDFIFFFSPISRWFRPIIVLALIVAATPYLSYFLREIKRQKQIEIQFLEFVRAIAGTVRSGIPLPKAIIQVANTNFGDLTPYIKKLSNQIGWGFPTQEALKTFAKDTKNKVIRRSISIVIEAEKSGGNMEDVLESVTSSVVEIRKIKEERKSSIHSQVIQGYIVFFVFIIIMLVLQLKLLPPLVSVTGVTLGGFGTEFDAASGPPGGQLSDIEDIFLYLVIIQGFFIGLMIGKFSEGSLKVGLKHSFTMAVLGYLIITVATGV